MRVVVHNQFHVLYVAGNSSSADTAIIIIIIIIISIITIIIIIIIIITTSVIIIVITIYFLSGKFWKAMERNVFFQSYKRINHHDDIILRTPTTSIGERILDAYSLYSGWSIG